MKRQHAQSSPDRHRRRTRPGPTRLRASSQAVPETTMRPCSCVNHECQFCEAKLYTGISGKQVNEIRGHLTHCRNKARQTLFRAGDPSTDLFVISEGQVKLTKTDIDGHEHLIGLAGAGYLLGFDTIGNRRYSYSAETLTPTVFCRIRHRDMMRILTKNPKVSLNVLLAVNEQLAQAQNLIRVLSQKSAHGKVAALLLSLIPSRPDDGHEKPEALHLSRNEMAEILGITVETVSRIMAQFGREAIIKAPRGSISIRQRRRLEALASSPLQPGTPTISGHDAPLRRHRTLMEPHSVRPVIK